MSDPKKSNLPADLKSMDTDQIIQALTENLHVVLKSAVIVVALVVAGIMFNDNHSKEQGLRSRISQMQQKLDAITAQQKITKELEDFKASFPKGIDEDKIITQITVYATAHNLSISSFSPTDTQDMGLYDVINVDFKGTAPDYKALVLFIRDIEKSPYLFRVNSCSAQGDTELSFSMKISVAHLHS
ncbi:MAG: hypothetical protein HQL14_01490 [Candidatus Omnitrophica bacterium]|nr:hypothetical protein [Candidatus Omnitrophota bacterium]